MHHIYRLWPAIASIAVLGSSLGPAKAREVVTTPPGYSAGTIVIHTNERKLYYYVDSTHAIRYPVGVGRAGRGCYSGAANRLIPAASAQRSS